MLTITGIIKYGPPVPRKKTKAEQLKKKREQAASSNKCTACAKVDPKPGFKQCEGCIKNGQERRARMLAKSTKKET